MTTRTAGFGPVPRNHAATLSASAAAAWLAASRRFRAARRSRVERRSRHGLPGVAAAREAVRHRTIERWHEWERQACKGLSVRMGQPSTYTGEEYERRRHGHDDPNRASPAVRAARLREGSRTAAPPAWPRIEGQVRGITRMIERDEYCIDVMQQTAALRAAVDSVTLLLMEDHVPRNASLAARDGGRATRAPCAEEVMEVVRRTMGRPARAPRAVSD